MSWVMVSGCVRAVCAPVAASMVVPAISGMRASKAVTQMVEMRARMTRWGLFHPSRRSLVKVEWRAGVCCGLCVIDGGLSSVHLGVLKGQGV